MEGRSYAHRDIWDTQDHGVSSAGRDILAEAGSLFTITECLHGDEQPNLHALPAKDTAKDTSTYLISACGTFSGTTNSTQQTFPSHH